MHHYYARYIAVQSIAGVVKALIQGQVQASSNSALQPVQTAASLQSAGVRMANTDIFSFDLLSIHNGTVRLNTRGQEASNGRQGGGSSGAHEPYAVRGQLPVHRQQLRLDQPL